LTRNTVEVFYHGARVASAPRSDKVLRDPIVNPLHMPENHRKYLSYNDDDFLSWASGIGASTHAVVKSFLESGRASEQGYKSCAGLTKMADRYGHDRVENACTRVLAFTSQPSIRNIATILKNRQDALKGESASQKTATVRSQGITRGADYFRRGGGASD
jgi:hypothetical protein